MKNAGLFSKNNSHTPVILSFFLLVYFLTSSIYSSSEPLLLKNVRYFAYQLTGIDENDSIQKIVDSKYDMIIIEPSVTADYAFDAKDMVQRIKASKASDGVHRKSVIAYIDIGQAEEWRWYWDGHVKYEEKGECKNPYITAIQVWAPWVVACDPDGWAGNYPVAFWDEAWKDIVINGSELGSHLGLYFNSMLDEVIQDGFDGVFLDWVAAWEMDEVIDRAESEGKNAGIEMLNFIKAIRTYGKKYNPDFVVIQQNSSELIYEVGANQLKNAVDAISQESVWWEGYSTDSNWDNPDGYDKPSCCTDYYLERLRAYKTAGFPVFVCDYAVKNANEVYTKAASEGFIAYATRRSLSRLTTTPPVFVINQPPVISIDRKKLYFASVTGSSNPKTQSFLLSNSGNGTLNWYLSENTSWLSCKPTSGIGNSPTSVTVSVDAAALSPGTYPAAIAITDPNASNSPQAVDVTLTVYENGKTSPPFGSIDSPIDGSVVQGSIPITGWALDDLGIEAVKIYVQTNNSGPLQYIGDAVMVEGARPDIEQAFPHYPFNYKAGWGYMMLTHFLPNQGNGLYTLHVSAIDYEGNSIIIGTKTITCDNSHAVKPFGAIDTPSQGGIASGKNYINFGWALTPQPNKIPLNGSTITVWIDGKPVGHPVYNNYRKDIADLFPGYFNSSGASAYFYLDTTKYQNGVHTIGWSVKDNAGNEEGIGSRFFITRNDR